MSAHPSFISVNLEPAMSGYFATLWTWQEYDGYGLYEPWESGFGRYPTWEGANREGAEWAAQVGLEFRPATQEALGELEAWRVEWRKTHPSIQRVKEIRDATGCSLKEALGVARKELADAQG